MKNIQKIANEILTSEIHFYGPDKKDEQTSGLSDSKNYKWKNMNSVKAALKKFFKNHVIKMNSKSEFIIEGTSLKECKELIERFNTSYNEQFNNFEELSKNIIKVNKK